jgi:hypothetical protein
MSTWFFKTQLRLGQMGEMMFEQAFQGKYEKLDGKGSDFRCTSTGVGIELKTDFWSLASTPNFFIERWSDVEKKKPGGPWQALEKGSTRFYYFYVPDLTLFEFDTASLVSALEPIIVSIKPFDVKNERWTTQGFRVPRELLKDQYTEIKLSVALSRERKTRGRR